MERCIGEPAGGTGSAAIVLAAAPQQLQPLLGIPVPNGQIPARRQHPVLASGRKSVDQQATNRGRADPGATFDPSRPSGSQGVSLFLAEGAHGLITQEEAVSLGDCVA